MRTMLVSVIALAFVGCTIDGEPEPIGEEPSQIAVPSPTPSPSPTPAPTSPQSPSSYDLTGMVLVVEGDELGLGAQSYAGRYATNNPSLTVHNLSSEGATVSSLLSRRDKALALNPDVLTISLGLHDLCKADGSDAWVKAIDDYAQPFIDNGTKVVITTPLLRDSAGDEACDNRHRDRFPGANSKPFSGSYDFFSIAHFGGNKTLTAPGATADSNLFIDGILPTASAQEGLAQIYARTLDNVWSVLLNKPALKAPADDGQTIIVAEGSSSAVTFNSSFNGLYRNSRTNFDEWHASAIGGSGINSLTDRIDKVKAKNADVVSVYIGANDLGSYPTVDAFTDKLRSYAEQLRERGTKVLVFTLPNKLVKGGTDHNHNNLRKQLKPIFEGADWIDGYVDFAGHSVMGADSAPLDIKLFKDGIHATSYGHKLYFETYAPALDRVVSKQHPARK